MSYGTQGFFSNGSLTLQYSYNKKEGEIAIFSKLRMILPTIFMDLFKNCVYLDLSVMYKITF